MKVEDELFKFIREGSLEKVKEILQKNPNLDINYICPDATSNEWGNTLLLEALDKENLDIAIELLKNRANPWIKNKIGCNALHMLCMVDRDLSDKNKAEKMNGILDQLVNSKEFKEELNVLAGQENYLRSPLSMAIAYLPLNFSKTFVQRLMQLGAQYLGDALLWDQLIIRNDLEKMLYYQTVLPLEFSINKLKIENKERRNALQEALHAPTTSIGEQIMHGNIGVLQFVYDKASNNEWLETINNPIKPVLHEVIAYGRGALINIPILQFLLQKGADPTQSRLKKTCFEKLEESLKINDFDQKGCKEALEILSQHPKRNLLLKGPK